MKLSDKAERPFADVMRQRLKGNEVTYGVVRNINYTSESFDAEQRQFLFLILAKEIAPARPQILMSRTCILPFIRNVKLPSLT